MDTLKLRNPDLRILSTVRRQHEETAIHNIRVDYFDFLSIENRYDWIKRGENGHYVVKRIKDSEKVLTPETLIKMKQIGEKYAGIEYDLYFEWSDSKIYCSELVRKIYKEAIGLEIGELEKLGDFNLTDNAVKQKLAERYGDTIPKDELVISPASIFNSDLLFTIYNNQ